MVRTRSVKHITLSKKKKKKSLLKTLGTTADKTWKKRENYLHLPLLFRGYQHYQLQGKVSSMKCSLFNYDKMRLRGEKLELPRVYKFDLFMCIIFWPHPRPVSHFLAALHLKVWQWTFLLLKKYSYTWWQLVAVVKKIIFSFILLP